MIFEGVDGVDFINIYSRGATELGRWLSNFARQEFECEHGRFASIEAYWYWLGCEDDDLRSLYGFKAKQEGRKRDRPIHREGFEDLIRKAIDIKIKNNRAMMAELMQSTLPLCHFYEYQGKRVDAGFEWIVEHIENRRALLKEWFLAKTRCNAVDR